MFNTTEMANQIINTWLEETRGLPVTLQLTKLGFKVIEALESAYNAGKMESGGIAIPSAAVKQLMPMCPFCNRETTYVVPNSNGTFHCYNCGGDFDQDGEPVFWPDEDEPEDDLDFDKMIDEFQPYMPPRYAPTVHPAGKTQVCPECSELMLFAGVMQHGNVLTDDPTVFVARWDCDACKVIVSDAEIDQAWAVQQWQRQIEAQNEEKTR